MTEDEKRDLQIRIQETLDQNPAEIDWSYDSGLDEEQIEIILTGDQDRIWEVSSDIYDRNLDGIMELETSQLHYILEEYYQDELDQFYNGDWQAAFDDLEIYANVDVNMKRLCDLTEAHINVVTKIEHHWSGFYFNPDHLDYEDIEAELEFLGLNPAEVGEALGFPAYPGDDFPNIENRTPIVDLERMVTEWINHTTEYSILTFTATVDLYEIATGKINLNDGIVVPEGTPLWLHDHINGSCSPGEALLLHDLTLEPGEYELEVDGKYGYGLNDICGLYSRTWTDNYLSGVK